jgi:hypothetical protein
LQTPSREVRPRSLRDSGAVNVEVVYIDNESKG